MVEPPLLERRPSFSSLPAVIVHKYSVQRQLSNNGAFGEVYTAKTVAADKRDAKRVIDAEIRTFRSVAEGKRPWFGSTGCCIGRAVFYIFHYVTQG